MRKRHENASKGISITFRYVRVSCTKLKQNDWLETTDVMAMLRYFLSHFLVGIAVITCKKHSGLPANVSNHTARKLLRKSRKIQVEMCTM